jgi:hypothetical protein
MRLRSLTVAALAAGALLVPAAAQAATKPVFAGTPPKGALPGLPETTLDNAFYPGSVKIHKGDSLKFNIVGFHNVLFAPKGTTPPGILIPAGRSPASRTPRARTSGSTARPPSLPTRTCSHRRVARP